MPLRADRHTLQKAALLTAALASERRLHIVVALMRTRGGLVASDLGMLVGLSPAALSQQLRVLERAGVVEGQREGQHVRYRLAGGIAARRARRIVQLLCDAKPRR